MTNNHPYKLVKEKGWKIKPTYYVDSKVDIFHKGVKLSTLEIRTFYEKKGLWTEKSSRNIEVVSKALGVKRFDIHMSYVFNNGGCIMLNKVIVDSSVSVDSIKSNIRKTKLEKFLSNGN